MVAAIITELSEGRLAVVLGLCRRPDWLKIQITVNLKTSVFSRQPHYAI